MQWRRCKHQNTKLWKRIWEDRQELENRLWWLNRPKIDPKCLKVPQELSRVNPKHRSWSNSQSCSVWLKTSNGHNNNDNKDKINSKRSFLYLQLGSCTTLNSCSTLSSSTSSNFLHINIECQGNQIPDLWTIIFSDEIILYQYCPYL